MKLCSSIIAILFCQTISFAQDSTDGNSKFLNAFLEVGKWVQELDDQVVEIVDKEKKARISRSVGYLLQDLYEFKDESAAFVSKLQLAVKHQSETALKVSEDHLEDLEKNMQRIGKRLQKLRAQMLGKETESRLFSLLDRLNQQRIGRSEILFSLRYFWSEDQGKDLEGMLCEAEQLVVVADKSIAVCHRLKEKADAGE